MRTVDFDKLSTSAPLNADAAIARDGSGEHYEPVRNRPLVNHWDVPPACERMPDGLEDLSGRTFGRFRVLRYFGSKDGARWLCRCSCGRYEARRKKGILKEHKIEAMCQECEHVRHIGELQTALRTGRWPSGDRLDEKMFQGMKTARGHLKLVDGYINTKNEPQP